MVCFFCCSLPAHPPFPFHLSLVCIQCFPHWRPVLWATPTPSRTPTHSQTHTHARSCRPQCSAYHSCSSFCLALKNVHTSWFTTRASYTPKKHWIKIALWAARLPVTHQAGNDINFVINKGVFLALFSFSLCPTDEIKQPFESSLLAPSWNADWKNMPSSRVCRCMHVRAACLYSLRALFPQNQRKRFQWSQNTGMRTTAGVTKLSETKVGNQFDAWMSSLWGNLLKREFLSFFLNTT